MRYGRFVSKNSLVRIRCNSEQNHRSAWPCWLVSWAKSLSLSICFRRAQLVCYQSWSLKFNLDFLNFVTSIIWARFVYVKILKVSLVMTSMTDNHLHWQLETPPSGQGSITLDIIEAFNPRKWKASAAFCISTDAILSSCLDISHLMECSPRHSLQPGNFYCYDKIMCRGKRLGSPFGRMFDDFYCRLSVSQVLYNVGATTSQLART